MDNRLKAKQIASSIPRRYWSKLYNSNTKWCTYDFILKWIIKQPFCLCCNNKFNYVSTTHNNGRRFSKMPTIDRFNFNKGYDLDNCVLICTDCNNYKSNICLEILKFKRDNILKRIEKTDTIKDVTEREYWSKIYISNYITYNNIINWINKEIKFNGRFYPKTINDVNEYNKLSNSPLYYV